MLSAEREGSLSSSVSLKLSVDSKEAPEPNPKFLLDRAAGGCAPALWPRDPRPAQRLGSAPESGLVGGWLKACRRSGSALLLCVVTSAQSLLGSVRVWVAVVLLAIGMVLVMAPSAGAQSESTAKKVEAIRTRMEKGQALYLKGDYGAA